MYDELVKRLRDSKHEIDCSLCDRDCCYPDGKVHGKCIIIEASDAIEELSVVVRAQKAMLDKFPRWIPVTERLPKEDGWYQVYAPTYSGGSSSGLKHIKGNMYSAFKNGKWSIEVGYYKRPGCVTHWMPLPEPPKEE